MCIWLVILWGLNFHGLFKQHEKEAMNFDSSVHINTICMWVSAQYEFIHPQIFMHKVVNIIV